MGLFGSASQERASRLCERSSAAAFPNRGAPVHFCPLHSTGDCESRVRRGAFGGIIPFIPLKHRRQRKKCECKQGLVHPCLRRATMVASVPGQAGTPRVLLLYISRLAPLLGEWEARSSAMTSAPKLLLLLFFWRYHSLVAHAGDDRSYKVLSLDSLKPDAACSERKGTVPCQCTYLWFLIGDRCFVHACKLQPFPF